MKHLNTIFYALRGVVFVLLTVWQTPLSAQQVEEIGAQDMDSVEICLLTCQPHDEVYSLYGHTAIRYHDLRKGGIDAAFNYGVFNFHAPYFALRFVFGLTDYELDVFPYAAFEKEYRYFGSMVTEQVLNLSNEEKLKLRLALAENLLPGNAIYRYNYFYNNCTTKARDIIEQCINGRVEYAGRKEYTPTFREMVHEMTRQNPWSRWGNDLLLGIGADQATTLRLQEFLPNNLMHDFDRAQIRENGQYRPLVKERRIAVPAGVQIRQDGFPLTPLQCSIILMAIGLVLFIFQWRLRQVFLVWEVLLMTASGIIGIVLFLMLFSQHPTVRVNFQILFFNPIHLVFLWSVIKGRARRYWGIIIALTIFFLIGNLFQTYAEGIQSLALCLLLQAVCHTNRIRKA